MELPNEFGKTLVDNQIEERIKAELTQVREAKSRIVKAISNGIINETEAASEIDDLRAKEQRLERKLISLHRKEAVRRDYLDAIKTLKAHNIEATVWEMYQNVPAALRRLLLMIFEPCGISFEVEGYSTAAKGKITDYQFTTEFSEFEKDINRDQRHLNVSVSG